jgi:hypothetical protein
LAILSSATTQPAGLTRDFAEFLLELGLALQRYALYPGGHPSVDSAVADLTRRMGTLLEDREVLSLGVARRQLVVEGVATEASHPVLRSVAERLHRHRIGVVTFRRGIEAAELSSALRAVSEDPDRTTVPVGLAPPERMAEWPHVRFHALTYEQLQLATDEADDQEQSEAVQAKGTSAAELWVGLARAALAKGDSWGDEDRDADPEQVAHAINANRGQQAYDQVIVGFMLQLADELRREGGAGVNMVRRRVSQVVRRLDPATMDRLLEMGGDGPQRARFLHHATRGLRPDAVLEVLGAAARAEGQDISTSMVRLLRKLSTAAEGGDPDAREHADGELRDQVRGLLVGWSLVDPNPGAYTSALESMSRTNAPAVKDGPGHVAEPLRIVQMGVEVGAAGVTFTRSVRALISAGETDALFAVVDAAPLPNEAVDAAWRQLESADHVRRVLTTDPIDFAVLDRLLPRLQLSTVISLLLDRISESESRATRMGVFLRLVGLGLPVLPAALERLHDPRWYVLRNVLLLVNEIGSWPTAFSALPYARHEHVTVRREALQLAVQIEAEREEAITLALNDDDERAMRIGVNAAREHGLPAAAVNVLLKRIEDPDLSPDIVATLLRLVSRERSPVVVDVLLSFVLHSRRLLGGARLAPRSPEMLAALSSLTHMPADDPRTRTALELARASTDDAVREAARVRST